LKITPVFPSFWPFVLARRRYQRTWPEVPGNRLTLSNLIACSHPAKHGCPRPKLRQTSARENQDVQQKKCSLIPGNLDKAWRIEAQGHQEHLEKGFMDLGCAPICRAFCCLFGPDNARKSTGFFSVRAGLRINSVCGTMMIASNIY